MCGGAMAALAALLFVSLLDQQSALAQAADESGLSLTIRCATNVLRVGDEIPIEFVISNHGREDCYYENMAGQRPGFKLLVKTASGQEVPEIPPNIVDFGGYPRNLQGLFPILHPGHSVTNTIVLNRWFLVKEAGRYEIVGAYSGRRFGDKSIPPLSADPISIAVLPRTKAEMDEYIKGLTNQVEARLRYRAGNRQAAAYSDGELDGLLRKLMYTCSPAIVPMLLTTLYEPGTAGRWASKALLCYVPHTEDTWEAIIAAAAQHGVNQPMYDLLSSYEHNKEAIKPIIERALAPESIGDWDFGAQLAGNCYYDDAFTARLIAIAVGSNTHSNTRRAAMEALARNRTDAGVKALKMLLNHPDPDVGRLLADAICIGYSFPGARPLRQEDFDANDVRPLTERLLNSGERSGGGLGLAELFGDDIFTPRLVQMTMDRTSDYWFEAIEVLAMNRTDEGVKTLRAILNDPDPSISMEAEEAILSAHLRRGASRGKPLRADDFDAKEMRPIIERDLTLREPYLSFGLALAQEFGDDSLIPRLAALATKPDLLNRDFAIRALSFNRSDEGVKTLKALLNDPDPNISKTTENAIREAYTSRRDAEGRPLRPDDFDVKFQQPALTPAN
jgi:HEAT repeat protein